jgi:polysaccharide biosynthesis/export protein
MMNYLKIKGFNGASWICSLVLLLVLSSCGVNSNVMLKTPYGETASLDSLPLIPNEEYRIAVDDKVGISLSVNGGVTFFDAQSLSGGGGGNGSQGGVEFIVRRDSTIQIPILGTFKIGGLTVRQAINQLEKAFSKDFKEPFVQVKVTNQRVIIFPGDAGKATVVMLQNANTTLMEVLAFAGGISERGKANTIKLIRKVGSERKMYVIDLSTIEGLKYTDLIVQANDYIYVEPKPRLAEGVLKEVAPILSIFSSMLIVVSFLTILK